MNNAPFPGPVIEKKTGGRIFYQKVSDALRHQILSNKKIPRTDWTCPGHGNPLIRYSSLVQTILSALESHQFNLFTTGSRALTAGRELLINKLTLPRRIMLNTT